MSAELSYTGIALWLVPSPQSPTALNLSSLISTLAAKYDTSAFLPHITLLSGISRHSSRTGSSDLGGGDEEWTREIVERVKRAVRDHQGGFQVTYEKLGSKPTPFQYLYIQITKSSPLVTLHHSLARQFAPSSSSTTQPREIEGDELRRAKVTTDYFPHLSLMYGEDGDSPPRNSHEIILKLINNGSATSPPDPASMEISEGEKCTVGGERGFSAVEIVVMMCEGPVSGWRALGRVPLNF